MIKPSHRSSDRVLVIGLDCATLDLVKPWADEGRLPVFRRLMNEGAYGILESTIPSVSPPAWASFMTGKNPGKHGIFDFIERREHSYHLKYIRMNLPNMGTIFRWLSEAGHRVGIVGVPMTYPPEPVNGFMIAGPWAPEDDRFAYPQDLVPFLKQRGYTINNSMAYTPERAGEFLDYLVQVTDTRAQVILELMEDKPWEFFTVVFRDVDTIQHFYWRYMDSSHPQHSPDDAEEFEDAILDYYRQLGRYIEEMLRIAGEDTTVIILSDHGAGPFYKEVYLNNWLAQQGLLCKKPAASVGDVYRSTLRRLGITRKSLIGRIGWPLVTRLKELAPNWAETLVPWPHASLIERVDWSKTRAYSFGHIGQIYVNLEGREPEGTVSRGAEYDALVEDLIERLRNFKDPETDEPIVDAVFRKQEIYDGPHLEKAPDLNVIFKDMSYISHIGMEFSSNEVLGPPVNHESGTHRLDGMLIAHGPPIRSGLSFPRAHITDVAPTILYLMGLPIPTNMDGRLLETVVKDSFLEENPPRSTERSLCGPSSQEVWSAEEMSDITRHLRDLGYLE